MIPQPVTTSWERLLEHMTGLFSACDFCFGDRFLHVGLDEAEGAQGCTGSSAGLCPAKLPGGSTFPSWSLGPCWEPQLNIWALFWT